MTGNRLKTIVLVLAALLAIPPLLANQPSSNTTAEQAEVVVLIHGLGRSKTAMWRLAGRLEDSGYEVHRIGYSSINTTPQEIIEDVSQQINDCCSDAQRTIHFVGHSLGGLLIRAYLQEVTPPRLGNTVLIGTPNHGTDIADQFQDNCLIELIVPTALALGTDQQSLPNQLQLPYYPVGVIAGVYDSDDNEDYLPGLDDGLVTVESTKLEGMADFVQVETGHSMMRYNKEVAEQVLAFLKNGRFTHSESQ